MGNVWLVDRSLQDVENLEIKVWTGNEQTYLTAKNTHIEGTVEFLKCTAEYEKILQELQNSITEKQRRKMLEIMERCLK